MGTTDPKDSSDSGSPAVAVTARARQNSGAVPGPQDALSAMALDVQILGPLSEGPLSRTWRAKTADERPVALVVLRDELTDAERERFAGAFERVRSLAELPPGVLRVVEVASSRDAFLTELWTIGTANELRTLAWPARRRLDFVRRAALAIDALHRAGIVHGGLSEEVILLSDAFDPIVADAGTLSIPALIEQHRDAASSVSFAAPEVLEGAEPNVRSDIFSMGRLLQHVFRGDSVPEIAEVLGRCLAPAPYGRYETGSELATALVAAADALATTDIAVPVAPPPPPKPTTEAERPARALEGAFEAEKRAPTPPPRWLTPTGVALAMACIAIAFVAGGSNATLRAALSAAVFGGAFLAAWGVPPSPSTSRALRIGFASACGVFLLVVDPLTLGYRVAAAHALRGSAADRLTAIHHLLQLDRDFEGLSLAGIDLSGMDLRGANMRGADLSGANLTRANLWGAMLQGATLGEANASDANLQGTDLASAHGADRAQCTVGTLLPPPWRCTPSRAGAPGQLTSAPRPPPAP
jgi:pentapeptide repeat protein/protein tyrosine kinase